MPTITSVRADSATAAPQFTPDVASLVRKSRVDETLITDWRSISETVQHVSVRWPEQHAFYAEGGRYSPLLLTESVRQALAVLTHSAHDVPLGHRLGMERLRMAANPRALYQGEGSPVVTLQIRHTSVRRRKLGSAHFVSQIEAHRAGQRLGLAEVHYSTYPPALYERLRGSYADARQAFARALPAGPPVPSALVGRRSPRDIVLTATGLPAQWVLRLNTDHQVLFDHPHDHVPGMVLLEAAAQATQAVVDHPVMPSAFDAVFQRYVEFDQPCLVAAVPARPSVTGRSRVRVDGFQDGRRVFAVNVLTAPRGA